MEALTNLLKDFDINAMLPQMDTLLGRLTLLCWVFITVGPVLLLGFGLKFFFLPAKTPRGIGFRTYFVTGSNEAWRFAQRLAGLLWMITGGVLLVVSLVLGLFFGGMELMTMTWTAVIYCGVQLLVVIALYTAVTLRTLKFYDRNGNPK